MSNKNDYAELAQPFIVEEINNNLVSLRNMLWIPIIVLVTWFALWLRIYWNAM